MGRLRFDLSADFRYKVEYHPPGERPRSFMRVFGNYSLPYRLNGAVPLDEGWYLAWYSPTPERAPLPDSSDFLAGNR